MRPPSVRMPPKNFRLAGNADALDQKLGEATWPFGRREGRLPHGDGKAAITVDGRRSKKISTDNRSSGLERVIQWSMRFSPRRDRAAPRRVFRHDAALAIGHADLDAGYPRHGSRAPRTSDPPRRPARRVRRSRHCPGPSPAGFRRGRPIRARSWHSRMAARPGRAPACIRSAITAACLVSAPSSREITSAMSRPDSPSASSDSATCGSFAQATASACASAASSISSPSEIGLPGAQAQQVARRQVHRPRGRLHRRRRDGGS